ncbi:DUF2283 domain-containing protein [archaeon]|jgi:uncharacterized protein YuzE|nr:DUF2283 domain-containing protein [archaeon]MBT3578110.1 DUF2283 domain-containing protein [archaeon]MBT6820658.1 DUF2283 domain-containing protein [archaeon]MBT6955697.1 DUF2283 domain-containing protein [archaeon]MBT7024932.1 DUF2283 domain-containing protein [archaeon]
MKGIRKLKGSGKIDYDQVNDILFFKVDGREYSHSVELLGYVIDLDTEGFVVGLQIFDASRYFNIPKIALRQVNEWNFEASLIDGVLQVKLSFNLVIRNRIVEKSPILVQKIEQPLPNSRMMCVA